MLLNTGNSYQTVTIVPSEVTQGGEVSYVLIVSQPEGETAPGKQSNKDLSLDMSVYDFKEDKGSSRLVLLFIKAVWLLKLRLY